MEGVECSTILVQVRGKGDLFSALFPFETVGDVILLLPDIFVD